jgi:hypothetical protein
MSCAIVVRGCIALWCAVKCVEDTPASRVKKKRVRSQSNASALSVRGTLHLYLPSLLLLSLPDPVMSPVYYNLIPRSPGQ